LKAKLALTINHASAKAKAAVEEAGGSIALIEKKVLPADEAKRQKTAAKRAKTGKAKPAASED
jgi:large subunit ribosomal protein L15